MTDTLPFLHSTAPPLRGVLKSTPADFVVEEIPAYLPSGDGEHLMLFVEKEDVAAEFLLKHVARTLEISQGNIGCAGMKDRRAITRQWLSVPAKCADRVPQITTEQIRVLDSARHGNKLRTGHLKGNRFAIVVRDVQGDASEAQRIVDAVQHRGFPNYYGDQRFGHDGGTLQLGFDLLARRQTPRDIPFARRKFLLKLALSAAQSELFNRALAARIADGLVDTVLAGDVMEVVASGGKFVVEDPAVEQPRCAAYETVITGPMFGTKMRQPTGVPGEREARLLADAELTPESFGGFRDLLDGTRRPYLVRPGELTMTVVDDTTLRFEFALPPGVYATTLLRELIQSETPEAQG
jgi:tRNA pseudouridine13 synthase